MTDDRVDVFVLDASGALHQETGNSATNNETFGIYGSDNRLRWQTVALIVASLLLVFFGATMWFPPRGPPRDHHYQLKVDPVQGVPPVQTDAGSCDLRQCTSATCTGFKTLNELKNALQKLNCETLNSLSITRSSIGATLEKNWLPANVHVLNTLTLDNVDVADIASDAFEGAQLSNVSNVILSNLPNVRLLRRDIFRCLVNLGGVRLENLHGLVQVEKGIVSDLPSPTFNDLQLTSDSRSVADLLPSFTGEGNTLPHLVKVIYAGDIGRLRYDQLAGLNLESVAMVFLKGAGITAVEEGALVRDARGVHELVLTLNGLTTLAKNALDIARFPKNSTFLENNPWDCTCPLAWLLDVKDRIYDNPICVTPKKLENRTIKSLSYEELCSDVTETPTEQPPTTAPPPPPTAKPGPCNSAEAEEPPGDFRGERILTETPQGKVVVRVPDAFRHQSMEWSGNDGQCYQVDVGARSLFQVSAGLKRGASYTFCFLEGASVVIGRCYPITLLPPDDDRAWLTNGDKLIVITGVVAAGLLALLIPGCLIVVALRRWPAFLGKHIVVVKWRREDTVLAMPRDYDADSAGSDAPTYITPDKPTACQYASYYVRRLGDVFRRSAGPRIATNIMSKASRSPSLASTVTSDEGDFGAGRRWPRAPEPTPAWVRRPDFKPWGSSRPTLVQVVRPRGNSSTSGI